MQKNGEIMLKILIAKLKESVISVLPVSAIVLILMLVFKFEVTEIVTFAICALFLIIGISLFNLGADIAMTPMGESVGTGLTRSKRVTILLSVCFVLGLLVTIAEPDLTVLAKQINESNIWLIIIPVGIGVGLFLVLAVAKIVFHINLSALLLFFYLMLFAICSIVIDSGLINIVPLAFDSGGVTTGPITVPFIMALGFGISSTIGGKDANENSFGLIALCSVGPMIAVMILFLILGAGDVVPETYPTVSDNLAEFGGIVLDNLGSVALALGLIVAFFLILQFAVLKLPKTRLIKIGIGVAYTFVGLIIFLVAVTVGFIPVGAKLGEKLAEFNQIFLVAFGFVIGMVVVLAEPAVHVLNKQVETVTDGGVKKLEMLIALSGAVGISIGLSMIRMIFGFSLLFYLIPGYLISLGLSFFVPKIYTAIAFDSGGVASGPLTSSFILPLVVGACYTLGGNVLTDAFGVVAMVAMTPLITIQILGFKAVMTSKVRTRLAMRRILSADDEQIIYFK